MKGIFKSKLVLTCVALLLLVGALAVALVSNTHSRPALAYGKENWQIGFSGTGVAPGTGQGFGFWGWCAFTGVTSGKDGDCEFSQYVHGPASSGFTCQESLDITSWDGSGGTFVINGATITVHPTSQTGNCLTLFPAAGFPFDTGFPAKAGHYNFTPTFLPPGFRGTLQVQVAQIP